MTADALNECTNLLSALPSPTQPWNEAALALYVLALKDWPDHVGRAACQHAALNCRWRPTPVELREIALARFAPAPSLESVVEAVRRVIVRHPPEERAAAAKRIHPVAARVVDHLGGWGAVGMMATEETAAAVSRALPAQVADWHAAEADSLLAALPEPAGHIGTAPNGRALEGVRR